MGTIRRSRAAAILEAGLRAPVAVVGDFMLDRYLVGEASRISPEAPVPVIRFREETTRLGGAGNVAGNLAALGARVLAFGITGEDEEAADLRRLLGERGIGADGLLGIAGRCTTVKTRLLADHHPVARVDREDDDPVPAGAAADLLSACARVVPEVAGFVLCDYDKGVLCDRTVPPLLDRARQNDLPVFVDPKPPQFSLYRGVRLATPNHHEACAIAGWTDSAGDRDPGGLIRLLQERLGGAGLLITRGKRGMLVGEKGERPEILAAAARDVFDVTGAGDTVIAVASLALLGGATLPEAAELANRAAARVVARVGTAAVSRDELLAGLP